MKNKLIFLAVLLLAVATVLLGCVSAPKVTEDGLFKYDRVNGRWRITEYLGSETNVIFPETIGKNKVGIVRIVNDNITSVVIPAGIEVEGRNFQDYYYMQGRATGTYSWKDGRCFFNDELLPKPVRIYGINDRNLFGFLWIKTINEKPADIYRREIISPKRPYWVFKPGTYNFKVNIDTYVDSPPRNVAGTNLEIKSVVLEEGIAYRIVVNRSNEWRDRLRDIGLGGTTVYIGIIEESHFGYAESAKAYISEDDYDKAIADYDQALYLNPTSALTYYDRGDVYFYFKKDYDKAITDFTVAISLQEVEGLKSYHRTYYSMRAKAYFERENYDLALADYEAALRLNPKDTFYRYYIDKCKAALQAQENNN